MGQCCLSSQASGVSQISSHLFDSGGVEESNRLKLLLLGTGNAGKTTILKQLKLQYGDGFTADERNEYKFRIQSSCITSLQKLLYAATDIVLGVDAGDDQSTQTTNFLPENQSLVELFKNIKDDTPLDQVVRIDGDDGPSLTVADVLVRLWNDPFTQTAQSFENAIPSLEEPVEYLMQNIRRIASPTFEPNDNDIINMRQATDDVEIFDFTFCVKKEEAACRIVDVGGQRHFRRRWISEFQGLRAVMYIVGLDGFDQVIMEDGKTNRLTESMELFRDIVSSPFLAKTNVILVLNKVDIFKKKWAKLKQVYESNPDDPLWTKSYFFGKGDTITPNSSYQTAVEYVKSRFTRIQRQQWDSAGLRRQSVKKMDAIQKPKVYSYVTCATDYESMSKFIFAALKRILMLQNIVNNLY